MDYRLAKEIYNQPWHVDLMTWGPLTASLNYFRTTRADYQGDKSNQSFLVLKQETVLVNQNYQLDDLKEGDKAVAVIMLDGPITKHGGLSHYGTLELAAKIRAFNADERVVGFIISVESGGGSSMAVAEMSDAMQEVSKPIVVWGDGIMASAAMYIASYADYIFMHRNTDRVGSIGTMIEFAGYPKQSEDKQDGMRFVRLYATESSRKNFEFEEAINESNFKPITDKLLNPTNERFISDMKQNRPNVTEEQLSGQIYDASEVVGTLIDDIGTFKDAVNKVLELSSKSSTSSNINNNQKTSEMTLQELQANHSDLYNSVLDAGVKAERDRVGAYLTFVDVDPKAVVEGIESGENPSQKFYAEMTRKQANSTNLKKVEEESPKVIKQTEKKEEPKSKEDVELKQFESEMSQFAGGTSNE
jgi:ClpP class serine protease